MFTKRINQKKKNSNRRINKNSLYICILIFGLVAERLGRGLQNLVQRFESARDLKGQLAEVIALFYFKPIKTSKFESFT